MIAQLFTGSPGPEEQKKRRRWVKGGNWQTVRTFRGTSEAIEGMIGTLQGEAVDLEIEEEDGGYVRLIATMGDAQDGSSPDEAHQLSTTWELVPNGLEKDLWEIPKVTTILLGMSTSGQAAFRKDVEEALAEFKSPDDVPFASNATLKEFYRCLLLKVDKFPASQFALQRIVLAAPGANFKSTYVNINRALTKAALYAANAVPAELRFVIPDAGYWIQQAPEVKQQNTGQWQHVQAWHHVDDYTRFIYEAPITS